MKIHNSGVIGKLIHFIAHHMSEDEQEYKDVVNCEMHRLKTFGCEIFLHSIEVTIDKMALTEVYCDNY